MVRAQAWGWILARQLRGGPSHQCDPVESGTFAEFDGFQRELTTSVGSGAGGSPRGDVQPKSRTQNSSFLSNRLRPRALLPAPMRSECRLCCAQSSKGVYADSLSSHRGSKHTLSLLLAASAVAGSDSLFAVLLGSSGGASCIDLACFSNASPVLAICESIIRPIAGLHSLGRLRCPKGLCYAQYL